jgi:hypothetical protein
MTGNPQEIYDDYKENHPEDNNGCFNVVYIIIVITLIYLVW